jgi:nucleotide-binding universal stress UspA family protein
MQYSPIMSTTIVVGVDFSPECEIAIEHALGLARRLGTSVTLALSTYIPDSPEGLSPGLMASYARYAADLKARLAGERDKLGALRERFSGQGVELSQVVLDGRPEEMIPKASKELDAALVAVGTHGRTGFRRFSMGSIAEKLVRYEARPVLVARGPAPAGGYRHIVVGLDFSPPSRKALQTARNYLAPDGKLDLVHCWQLPMWSYASGAPLLGDNVAQFQAELLGSIRETGEKWLAEVGPVDGRIAFHSLERTPAAGLDAWANEHKADLIVVGSHGHQGLRRWLIGSVAENTVRHAPCSVVVVH